MQYVLDQTKTKFPAKVKIIHKGLLEEDGNLVVEIIEDYTDQWHQLH